MPRKQTKTGRTAIAFLLDKSSSMNSVRDGTIEAFNVYLDELKKKPGGIEFTFVQFDSVSIDKIYVAEPLKGVKRLSRDTYEPRGGTPLIDAAYKTIKAMETAIGDDKKAKVVFCIQTDGQENESREHTWDELNALIREKTAAGWQFNFMGVGLDAYSQGARMGISRGSTMSYDVTSAGATRDAFRASAVNTMAFASGVVASTAYSSDQKMAAGDKFDGGGATLDLSIKLTKATLKTKKIISSVVDDITF